MSDKRKLVFDAFDNKKTQRVPVGFWFHFAPEELFVNKPEVIRKNVEGHFRFYDTFRPDFVKLMSDGFFRYPNPTLEKVEKAEDLLNAKSGLVDDWIDAQTVLVKELTDHFGSEVAAFYNIFAPATVLGFVLEEAGGGLTLAGLIRNQPETLAYVLNVIKQDLARLAFRVITEGKADGIYLSTRNIQDKAVSRETYHKYITPSEQGVLNVANALSDYNILHICGYEGARNDLSVYEDYDVKVINWAVVVERVSLQEGKKLFGGRAVIGGFDNTTNGVLYRGSKEEVENETRRLLEEAGTTGVILGADCTIPSDTPLERLNWVRKAARKIVTVGVIAALGIGATACGNAESTGGAAIQAQAKNDEDLTAGEGAQTAEGVTRITVAHTQAYRPYDFINENGESDGYEVAVLKAVDELLPQYEFEYVGTTDDDLLIGIESGKYDVGTKGVWWTKERAEKFVFPKHFIGTSIIGITIRSEDAGQIKDLDSFAAYSGNLVPIGAQNAQYTIVDNYNKSHPDQPINLVAGDQFAAADAYQWVLEGRYDAYIDIRTLYEANVVAQDGEYHDFADQLTYIDYEGIPTWPLFGSGNQALADAYDEAWEKLEADGTLERLQQEYFGYNLFHYVPEGYQIGDDL